MDTSGERRRRESWDTLGVVLMDTNPVAGKEAIYARASALSAPALREVSHLGLLQARTGRRENLRSAATARREP